MEEEIDVQIVTVEKLQVSKRAGRRFVEKEFEVQVVTEPHMVWKEVQLRQG